MITDSNVNGLIERLNASIQEFFKDTQNYKGVDISELETQIAGVIEYLKNASEDQKNKSLPYIENLKNTVEKGKENLRIQYESLQQDMETSEKSKQAIKAYFSSMKVSR